MRTGSLLCSVYVMCTQKTVGLLAGGKMCACNGTIECHGAGLEKKEQHEPGGSGKSPPKQAVHALNLPM